MADYLTYHLTVSVITPLHIGNGVELLNRYDYAIYKGQTWRINEAAFLDAQQIDDPVKAEMLAKTPPADLLKENDYSPESPFFRYVIKGAPRSKAEGAQLHQNIQRSALPAWQQSQRRSAHRPGLVRMGSAKAET